MIDTKKQYTTRSGLPVRIYATDGGDPYAVHGSYQRQGEWISGTWTKDGLCCHYGAITPSDLIEVKPRIKRTVWLNVYESGELWAYASKQSADDAARPIRLACVKAEIDCEEGEGL